MPPLIQAPQKAEPLPGSGVPEAPHLDAWFRETDQPTYRATPAPQPPAWTGPVERAELVTLDKWFQPTRQPTTKAPAPQPPAFSAPTAPVIAETITVDKWFRRADGPTYRQRPQQPPAFAMPEAFPVPDNPVPSVTVTPTPTSLGSEPRGLRIRPDMAPMGMSFPRLVYSRISTARASVLQGHLTLKTARYQMDCWGLTRASASQLGDAVRQAVQAFKDEPSPKPLWGTKSVVAVSIENKSNSYEEARDSSDVGAYCSRLDLLISYQE